MTIHNNISCNTATLNNRQDLDPDYLAASFLVHARSELKTGHVSTDHDQAFLGLFCYA